MWNSAWNELREVVYLAAMVGAFRSLVWAWLLYWCWQVLLRAILARFPYPERCASTGPCLHPA